MVGEITTPLLPCATIEETIGFYEALGFRTTYRQQRPNGYLIVMREDLELHFFSMDGFIPANSYGSCLIGVPDADALYAAFRDGLRGLYGKVPTSGIPRLTRPWKKQGNIVGFALIDPGGNWLRIHERARVTTDTDAPRPQKPKRSALATALHAAGILGDSKDDPQAAANLLDKALARVGSATIAELIAALVYRAELAVSLGDLPGATALIERTRAIPLDDEARAAVQGDLERADDLWHAAAATG
ncbi:MAG TPA: VOC family protein [Thermomicrobiales bacterium]|jgi:hypothetical protein